MSSSPRSSVDSPSASLPAAGSTSRLVLLPNTDDRDPFQDYATDDEDDDPQQGIDQLPIPPLPSSVVFLYLLSPYLRLGAMYASDIGNTPLTYGLTWLVIVASLSAFCRQIWFLLGRYLCKSSTEDILIHVFARRRRRVREHGLIRYAFTTISGLFRILLAAMYLRDSVDSALRLKVEIIPPFSRTNISIALSIMAFVLSLHRSLASKTLVYATSFSVASYLTWLVAVFYAADQYSLPNPSSLRRGVLWNGFSSLAFAGTTAMTVPLSASLIARTPSCSPASRNAMARSFQLLNIFSAVLAALLILPLVVRAALPRVPATKAVSDNLVLGLRIATLVLSIPSITVSITVLPLHGMAYQFLRSDLVLSVIALVILALSLAPPTIASILDDVTLFLAVLGSFLLPALAHIAVHYFRRPLSIVVPPEPSSAPSAARPSHSERSLSPSPSRDPLLQRKERLLQRRRFGRRLLWDVLIWTVLVPICVCALVWAVGRLARRW